MRSHITIERRLAYHSGNDADVDAPNSAAKGDSSDIVDQCEIRVESHYSACLPFYTNTMTIT